MANITIPNLPSAIALTGSEQVEVVQSNTSVRTTTQAIANLAPVNAITSLTINSPLYTSGSNPITSTGNIGLSSNGVTNNYLGTMPTLTLKGNNTGSTAAPTDLSVASVMTMLGAAPLLSPTFIGTPTAPTPATSDNSTQIATTAFVKAQTTASGTVTSVNGSGGTTGLSLTGGPITGAGTLTLGGTLGGASGGTGVNNGTNTITIAGNVTTVGAFPLTVTTTGTTSVTMPTTGTLTALGNATTGSGSIVLATSPVLVTPTLGAATATSVNGLTITSTTGGLTVASGKTLTASNSLALAGTDGSTLNVGTGGTLAALAFLSAAPAGTLTGSTLASGVTASSLTSVGTLTGLSVNGTINAYYTGKSGLLLNEDSSGNVFINQQDNGPLILNTNNTERMRITAAGNVGIGNSAPSYLLDVNGTGRFSGALLVTGNAYLNNIYQSNLNVYASYPSGTTGVDAGSLFALSNLNNYGANTVSYSSMDNRVFNININTTTAIELRASNTAQMIFSAASFQFQNYVGIGTSSPVSPLTVLGPGAATPSLSAAGGAVTISNNYDLDLQIGESYIPASGSAGIYLQSKRHSNDGSSWQIYLNPLGGSVGVGTNAPSSIFHIVEAADPVLTVTAASSGSAWLSLNGISSAVVHNPNNVPTVFTTNGTERMRISAAGNVGIGTSSPVSALTVSGSGYNGGSGTFISTTGGNSVTVNGVNAAGVYDSAYIYLSDGTNTGFVGLTAQNGLGTVGSLRFGVAGTEYARIQPNGNFGIGTNSPSYLLDVNGTGRFVGPLLVNSGSANANLQISTASTTYAAQIVINRGGTNNTYIGPTGSEFDISTNENIPFVFLNNGYTERMRITAAGNVGIGTSSPVSPLTVNGPGPATPSLSAAGGAVTISNNSDLDLQIGESSVTGSAGIYLQSKRHSNDGTSWAIYLNPLGGSVGVGTNAPGTGTILDVQSTTAGVRFPNMTTTQKTAFTPAAGTVVFDTTLAKLCLYTGAAWQTITSV
jgi:hypothetical protein